MPEDSGQIKQTPLGPTLPPPATLWERQMGESSRAFHAFTIFRDLPPNNRTLRMVQDIIYPNSPWAAKTIARWAKDCIWVDRVTAWENYLDQEKLKVQVETVRTMTERHIKLAQDLQNKGVEALEELAKGPISVGDARQLIVEGAKLERLSRGQSTEKYDQTEHGGFPDLSNYSEEDLRRLADLADRVVKGAGEEKPS